MTFEGCEAPSCDNMERIYTKKLKNKNECGTERILCPECGNIGNSDGSRMVCSKAECGFEGRIQLRDLPLSGWPHYREHAKGHTIVIFDHIGAAFDFDVREMVANSMPMPGYR